MLWRVFWRGFKGRSSLLGLGETESSGRFWKKRPAVFNFVLFCRTFHAGFGDQNWIWQQQAIIEFSCNSIIYHNEYSFINNDLFWNDSSCQFGGLFLPAGTGVWLPPYLKSGRVAGFGIRGWMHFTMCLCFGMCIISFLLCGHETVFPDAKSASE